MSFVCWGMQVAKDAAAKEQSCALEAADLAAQGVRERAVVAAQQEATKAGDKRVRVRALLLPLCCSSLVAPTASCIHACRESGAAVALFSDGAA